jgi:hypothetical protein
MSWKYGSFAATNDEALSSSTGACTGRHGFWLRCLGTKAFGIHGVTIGALLAVDAVACEMFWSLGKHTLGVNGTIRPSSAAVIRAIGGDGIGRHGALLGGCGKLISSLDQSISDVG